MALVVALVVADLQTKTLVLCFFYLPTLPLPRPDCRTKLLVAVVHSWPVVKCIIYIDIFLRHGESAFEIKALNVNLNTFVGQRH